MSRECDLARRKAAFLSTFANPKRLSILQLLLDNEVSVGALAEQVGLSQSATSQHLSRLRDSELIKFRRDAQTVYYAGNSDAVRRIFETLDEIFGAAEHAWERNAQAYGGTS